MRSAKSCNRCSTMRFSIWPHRRQRPSQGAWPSSKRLVTTKRGLVSLSGSFRTTDSRTKGARRSPFRELSAPGRIAQVSDDPFPRDRPSFKKHRETTGPDAATERHCACAVTNRIPSTAGPGLTSRQSGLQAVTAPASGRRTQRKEPAMANSTETRTPSSPRSGAEPDRSTRLPGRKRGATIAEPGALSRTCPPVRHTPERGRPS